MAAGTVDVTVVDFLGLVTNADEIDLTLGASPDTTNASFLKAGALTARPGLVAIEETELGTGTIRSLYRADIAMGPRLIWSTNLGKVQETTLLDKRW